MLIRGVYFLKEEETKSGLLIYVLYKKDKAIGFFHKKYARIHLNDAIRKIEESGYSVERCQ